MKYVIEFWNPWTGCWQRWNMEPVGGVDAIDMILDRRSVDTSLERRFVEATN